MFMFGLQYVNPAAPPLYIALASSDTTYTRISSQSLVYFFNGRTANTYILYPNLIHLAGFEPTTIWLKSVQSYNQVVLDQYILFLTVVGK